jgi:hypothetical protein
MDHTPETVDQWAVKLAQRFAGRHIAVALEQSRGPLVFMLSKHAHLVLFPVHPAAAANYRKSFRPSGAKDDPHDARLLLDLLMRHREKLRQLQPDTPDTRTLQFLVERCWSGSPRRVRRSPGSSWSCGLRWSDSSGPGRPPFVTSHLRPVAARTEEWQLARHSGPQRSAIERGRCAHPRPSRRRLQVCAFPLRPSAVQSHCLTRGHIHRTQ